MTEHHHKTEKQRNWFLRHKIWTVVIVIFGLAVIGSIANPPKTDTAPATQNQPQQQSKATPKPAKKSSQQIYDETQVGQTKEEVISNAGHAPDNCIDSEIAGVGQSSTCSWGTLSITFIDGKVSSKTKL